MKRAITILIACTMLLTLTACGHRHKVEHLVYTDDYPTVYQEKLKEIFGDYTLGERIEQHSEGEDCSCGYHRDTLDWYEWQIIYRDACGQTMTCTLDNMHSIYRQQTEWMKEQIQSHFWTNDVEPQFDGLMEEQGSYCFCFIGRISSSWYNEETRAYLDIGNAYLENLQNREEPIPLYRLTYREIFDRYPIRLSVWVRLAEDGIEESEWQKRFADAKARFDTMVANMTEEIGSELNLGATVGRDRLDIDQSMRYYRVSLLRGERYTGERTDGDFERAIMDSYKGKFW